MEKKRLELENILKEATNFVHFYYTPPNGMEMNYPCIVYELSDIDKRFADNIPYHMRLRWDVTIISEDPDEPAVMKVSEIPYSSFRNHFNADNLAHFLFNIAY